MEGFGIVWNMEYAAARLSCTDAEKRECFPLIKRVLQYAADARVCGLLHLECDIEDEPDPLLKAGLQLVVDARPPEDIAHYLFCCIAAGDYRGKAFLEKAIAAEGTIRIQEGINPRDVARYLTGWLGLEFMASHSGELDEFLSREDERAAAGRRMLSACPEQSVYPPFDRIWSAESRLMPLEALARRLHDGQLAAALMGSGKRMRDALLFAVSASRRDSILAMAGGYGGISREDCVRAQKSVLETAERLAGEGEAFWIPPGK